MKCLAKLTLYTLYCSSCFKILRYKKSWNGTITLFDYKILFLFNLE